MFYVPTVCANFDDSAAVSYVHAPFMGASLPHVITANHSSDRARTGLREGSYALDPAQKIASIETGRNRP